MAARAQFRAGSRVPVPDPIAKLRSALAKDALAADAILPSVVALPGRRAMIRARAWRSATIPESGDALHEIFS